MISSKWALATGASLLLALSGCGDDGGDSRPDAATAADAAIAPTPFDFVAGLADPLAPARIRPGTAWLRTSRTVEPAEGMRNDDFGHFVRVENGRAVLADEAGPGVITRLWFTMGPDDTIGDTARLHVWIDGEELELVPGESGVTLGQLTAGELDGFPQPWVLDRARASAGFMINVPLQYASSVRVELDELASGLWIYYQVDGRTLPAGAQLTPFTPSPGAAHDDALARATELWVEHQHPGDDLVDDARELASDATIVREVSGPGVITTLEVPSVRADRDALEVTIEIDGDEVARAPLGWLTGSAPPGGPYDSSLSASSEEAATLYAPIPFLTSARVVVRNAGDDATRAGLRVRVLEGAVPDDVGRFVARCSSQRIDVATSICEQQSTAEYPNVVVGGVLEGRGHYAGQTFIMRTAPMQAWWWALECDHEVYVDGEPALLGTGTEDYFGGAFYFKYGPFSSPTSGASGWERRDADDSGSDTHMFRWHLVDGIPFERELRFEYESYVDETRWDGCVFAYLER